MITEKMVRVPRYRTREQARRAQTRFDPASGYYEEAVRGYTWVEVSEGSFEMRGCWTNVLRRRGR